MKKLFIAALLTISVATTAFAADEKKVNVRVMNTFNTEFENAENVTWTVKTNFVKASFVMDGQRVDAFYDFNGESIGRSQGISLDDLPLSAKRTYAKKYADYIVKEAIKFDGVDESAYYVSAENDKHSVILKITNAGIGVFKKTAKN